MEELLTVKELAKLLKVRDSWVYDRTRRGGPELIPHIKIGRYIRFRTSEALEFLDQHRRVERG